MFVRHRDAPPFFEKTVSAIFQITPQEILGPLNDVEAKNAPKVLFALGRTEVFGSTSRVSVIGTRSPTPDGIRRAEAFVRALIDRGMVVVSGLAEGIDTVAHTTAIERGGQTVAVVGSGPDRPFPHSNVALWNRNATEHLLLSQFALGVPPIRTNFPQRNRTMALVSDATVIIEAGEGSGTLHQGWEALRLGRPLFLMESLTTRTDLSWPAEMIHYGAVALSRENLDDVLYTMPSRSRGELAF